ncbi:MAG TPA: hypothetical protein PLQ93_06765 [Bacteroidia bacterium]|nr:hypothetical protein [Bacteroidia bacterium]
MIYQQRPDTMVSKKKIILILLAFYLLSFSDLGAQSDVKQALIVSHVDLSSKTQFKQKIFAYHFLNGSFTGREELLTVNGKREGKDYIRTDRGQNHIYKNRYLITGLGNIIDLKEKKVLFDGRAKLLRCSNDSAIFYTDDIFKGKYYSVYNFSNNSYGEVKDLLFKTRYGRDVEFDKTLKPFHILYFPVGKPRIDLVQDAGYGQKEGKDSYVPDPPMVWMDNDNFMYCNFNFDNSEVSFVKVNVDSKKSTVIGKLDIRGESGLAEIMPLTSEQVLFRLGYKHAFIDLESESISEMDDTKPVYGFSHSCKLDPKLGYTIRLYGKEIGKYMFAPRNFVAGENIAAFVREMVIGYDSYQQGIMNWNATRQKWEAVDSDEVLALMGWIKE